MTRDEAIAFLQSGGEPDALRGEVVAQQRSPMQEIIGGARSSIGQGLAMGWGDELEAGVRAPFSENTYPELLNDIRRQNTEYSQAHPVADIGGQIGGGLLPAMIPGLQGMAVNAPIRTGATLGGLAGMGTSDPPPEDTIADKFLDRAAGTATGATVGGVFSGGVTGLTQLARQIRGTRGTNSQVGQALEDRLGGRTPEDIFDQVRSQGPTSTLADTDEFVATAATLANSPGNRGPAQKFFRDRQEGQPQRIYQHTRELTGVDASPHQYRKDLIAQRRAQAGIGYDELHAMQIRPSQQMLDYLELVPAGARNRALRDVRIEMRDPSLTMDDALDSPRVWDYIKQETAALGHNLVGKATRSKYTMQDLSNDIADELDIATAGKYKEVSGRYRADSKVLEAQDASTNFANSRYEEFVDEIAQLSPEAKKAYLVGFTDDLIDKVSKRAITADNAWALIRSDDSRRKMAALLGDDTKVATFIQRMKGEIAQTRTANMVATARGSRTAILNQENEDLATSATRFVASAASGQGGSFGNLLAKLFTGKEGMSAKAEAKLMELLMQPPDSPGGLTLGAREQMRLYLARHETTPRVARILAAIPASIVGGGQAAGRLIAPDGDEYAPAGS